MKSASISAKLLADQVASACNATDPDSQELLDRAAAHTILADGTVYVASRAHLPLQTTAVAHLRSPLYAAA